MSYNRKLKKILQFETKWEKCWPEPKCNKKSPLDLIFILSYNAKKENTSCPSHVQYHSEEALVLENFLHRQFMQSFFPWFFRYNWKTSDEKRFTSDSEKASQAVSVCPWVYSSRNLVIQKQKLTAHLAWVEHSKNWYSHKWTAWNCFFNFCIWVPRFEGQST